MLDSPKGAEMSDPIETLPGRVEGIERQLEARFNEVALAFAEQRRYTEFAFETLRTEMNAGFTRLDRKLDYLIDRLIPPAAH